jgi:hypothetical protein
MPKITTTIKMYKAYPSVSQVAEVELLNEMLLLTFVVCISSVKRIYLLSYCCVLLALRVYIKREGCHHAIDVICSLISVYLFFEMWDDHVLILRRV